LGTWLHIATSQIFEKTIRIAHIGILILHQSIFKTSKHHAVQHYWIGTSIYICEAFTRPANNIHRIRAAPRDFSWEWEIYGDTRGDGKLLYWCLGGGSTKTEGTCVFSKALSSQPGKPSIRDYLAMFSDKYVEHNGRFYAVKNSQANGAMIFSEWMFNGLYEILVPDTFVRETQFSCNTSGSGRCVDFKLLIEADNIGQIVAAPTQYNPVQVIGVDQVTNKIYGYYPTDSGTWARKQTLWGDAKNGSLWSDTDLIGLSTNDRLFNLWGDFNYDKHEDIECSGAPASIDAWSGRLADYRGMYCPGADNDQLRKVTWNSDGSWTKEELIWAPASIITRFESGIWGITTDGNLLTLWNDEGIIRSVPQTNLPSIHGVRAVGGLEDKYVWDSGVLLSNGDDAVYNVYWDGEWKEQEIFIDKQFLGDGKISIFFGSHGGEMYIIYGWFDNNIPMRCYPCSLHEVYLYHMKFVGGTERYQAVLIQGETFSY